MSYLLILSLIAFGLVSGLLLPGLSGAVLLGFTLLGLDFFWQWLRIQQVIQAHRSSRRLTIVPFFFVRLFSVLLLLQLSRVRLQSKYFLVCAAFSLALPLTGLAGAYLMRQRGLK